MVPFARTPLLAIVFPALVALLPGCQSCVGGDKEEQPATKTEEHPQMRGLQKVRMARPDMLGVREAGAAAATPSSSAIPAPTLSAAPAPSASH